MEKAWIVSIPHSGEEIPPEVDWLQGLDETIQMCDVDRFVDRLYLGTLRALDVTHVVARWHRYLADLNRLPTDVDEDSVQGAPNKSGEHTRGLHWVKTTQGHQLMPGPISMELHDLLVKRYHAPFHDNLKAAFATKKAKGLFPTYHLDAHSMPSLGTSAHKDPGQKRAEVVISDQDGTTCSSKWRDLCVEAYKRAGFQVGLNWPYKGGRVTETYGQPASGQHSLQVELNRALYMNEVTKRPLGDSEFQGTQQAVDQALRFIYEHVDQL